MGREWLFWGSSGGKSTKKPGKPGGRGDATAAAAAEDDEEKRELVAEAAAQPGCMCAVLQLFDLHRFQIALHNQHSFRPAASFLHDEPCEIPRKGLEAPRNSLELDQTEPAVTESDYSSSSSSTRRKEQQNLNIPVNIQIKTTRDNKSPRTSFSKPDLSFSDSCSSNSPAAGGNKTPTLVARLMGLDQLPPQLQTSTTPPAYGSTFNPQAHGLQRFSRDHYKSSSGLQNLVRNRSSSIHRSFYENDVTMAGSGGGTASLPETPRISSASSRRSDVDHGHRLSLQINKENINAGEDFEISAAVKNLARKRRELMNYERTDEDLLRKGGGDYAKEIVKQIKESVVRRKVGLNDITNTIKSRDQKVTKAYDDDDDDDDDHVVLLKPKKLSKVNVTKKIGYESAGPSKQSIPSSSPKSLLPWSPSTVTQQPQPGEVHLTLKPQHLKLREQEQQSSAVVQKSKKDDNEKCRSGIRRTAQVVDPMIKKKEEPFIRPTAAHKGNNATDKKCKKTPISNDLFNISVPNLVPVKRQAQASSSDGKVKWRSSPQMSSGWSHGYKQQKQLQVTHMPNFQDKNYRTTTSTSTNVVASSAGDQAAVELEYRYYIQRILKRAGVDRSTPLSLAKWYSPSHPLDPSIFHYIELFHPAVTNSNTSPGELNLRCNRKLVFQLVDELLADILKPYLGNPSSTCMPRCRPMPNASELIDIICSRIKRFPRADCKVLEDIDTLIDMDLGNAATSSSSSSWVLANYDGEERDKLVEEIQRGIMKSLVNDTEKQSME